MAVAPRRQLPLRMRLVLVPAGGGMVELSSLDSASPNLRIPDGLRIPNAAPVSPFSLRHVSLPRQ